MFVFFHPYVMEYVDRYKHTYLLLRMGLIAPRGKQLKTSLPSFVSMLAPFSLNGLVRGGSMGSLSLIRPKCSGHLTLFPPTTIQSFTVSLVVLLSITSAYVISTPPRYRCVAGIYCFVSVCFGFSFDQSFI